MSYIAIYPMIALLAVVFSYQLGLTEACLVVGKGISDVKTGTGFQDAITPPMSTKVTMATWIGIVGVLGYATYQFGWGTGGIALGIFLVVSILVRALFIPGPDSRHYVRLIYASMVRRYADFEKQGDRVRSTAIKDLIGRVEAQYAGQLIG